MQEYSGITAHLNTCTVLNLLTLCRLFIIYVFNYLHQCVEKHNMSSKWVTCDKELQVLDVPWVEWTPTAMARPCRTTRTLQFFLHLICFIFLIIFIIIIFRASIFFTNTISNVKSPFDKWTTVVSNVSMVYWITLALSPGLSSSLQSSSVPYVCSMCCLRLHNFFSSSSCAFAFFPLCMVLFSFCRFLYWQILCTEISCLLKCFNHAIKNWELLSVESSTTQWYVLPCLWYSQLMLDCSNSRLVLTA